MNGTSGGRTAHWWQKRILRVGKYTTIVLSAVVIFFPVYWLAIGSFRTYSDIMSGSLIPKTFTLDHYRWVISETFFLTALKNSLLVCTTTTVFSMMLSLIGAFSIARFVYPGRRILSQLTLFTYLVPQILLAIPLFRIIQDLGLYNTLWSLVVADTAFILPFCLWLLRGFIQTIPNELEEAAMVDGTTRVGSLVRITLPLTAPGMVAAAMFAWILSWNDYLFALILIRSDSLRTLPLHLSWYLMSDVGVERWGPSFAEAMMVALPVVLLFVFLQRFLVEGMTAGAVK